MKVETGSSIARVNVYRAGATVTRRAEVKVESARTLVTVRGLPVSLVDASVRVRPASGFTVRGVRLVVGLATSAQRAEDRTDAQRALDARGASLAAELAEVDRAIELLRGLRFPPRPELKEGASPRATDVKPRLVLAAELADATRDLTSTRDDLAAELDRATQAAAAHREASRSSSPREAFEKSVEVDLEQAEGGTATSSALELSYFVRRARWAPSYVLRVSRSRREATLELRASVAQASGEHWDDVALGLSSGDPHAFHELTELQSLRIGRREERARDGFRPLAVDPATLFADYARMRAPTPRAVAPPRPVVPPAPSANAAPAAELLADALTASLDQEEGGFGAGAVGGGAPERKLEMAARSMAMPLAPQSMTRASVSLGGMLPRKGGVLRKRALSYDDGPADEPRAPAEGEAAYDDRVFSYASLRMPAFQEQRGKLVLFEREALVRERWVATAPLDLASLTRAEEGDVPLAGLPPSARAPEAESGFHHRVDASLAVSVAPDGQHHSVPVLQRTMPVSLRYVVVPRESTDVFRRVELMNPLDVPLLAGPCDVYVDGEFLTTTALDAVGPRGELSVAMGVEQSIRVVRNTRFNEQSEGLIGGTLALHHEVRVELSNHVGAACEIEVRERVPVAADKEENVRVELGVVRPAWAPLRPRAREVEVRGVFAWRVSLEPDARADLSASYVVRIPSKFELDGGNRRS